MRHGVFNVIRNIHVDAEITNLKKKMIEYIGISNVRAEPCNSWKGDPGYHIVHVNGRTSWSSKEVFEKTYRPVSSDKEIAVKVVISMIVKADTLVTSPAACITEVQIGSSGILASLTNTNKEID